MPSFLAFTWVDRDRWYCVSNFSSLSVANEYVRFVGDMSLKSLTQIQKVRLLVPKQQAVEIYFSAYELIDRHNRCCEADLGLKKAVGTNE